MYLRCLLLLPILAVSGVGAEARRRPFAPATPSLMALSVPRGGAGPLDPEVTAKALAVTAMAQGLLTNVAPDLSNEQYGVKAQATDGAAQNMGSQVGCGVLAYGVDLYALLFQKTSLSTAMQAGYVLWCYQTLRLVLSGAWERGCGAGSAAGGWTLFAICAAAVYAMTQDYADTAIKALSALWTLTGVQMIVAPDDAWAAWKGDKAKLTDATKVLIKVFGWHLLAIVAIPMSMLMLDATPTEAAGYGSVVWSAFHLTNLIGKRHFNQPGLDEKTSLLWLAVNAVVAATTLL